MFDKPVNSQTTANADRAVKVVIVMVAVVVRARSLYSDDLSLSPIC